MNFNSPFEFNTTLKSSSIHESEENENEGLIETQRSVSNISLYINEDEKKENSINISNDASNNTNLSSGSKILNIYERIKDKVITIYSCIIPNSQKYPKFCFLIITLCTFLHSKITIFIIEKMSKNISISAPFLALTLISWSGNISDTINASVASKLNASELLTTSIIGSQIMNLQVCLGVPWLISIFTELFSKNNHKPVINFGTKDPFIYLIPLFAVVLSSILILSLFKVKLNKKSGICLICVYIFYLIYEYNINAK